MRLKDAAWIVHLRRHGGIRCLFEGICSVDDQMAKIRRHAGPSMYTANVLGKVLFARETRTGTALAIRKGAVEGLFSSTVHFVNLALVSKKTSTVSETLKLLASLDSALVWSFMFVHMLTPLTLPVESGG